MDFAFGSIHPCRFPLEIRQSLRFGFDKAECKAHVVDGREAWQEIAVMSSLYRGPRRAFADRRNEPLQINWRRGLFRVWLLLSAAWVMAWVIYLIMYAIRDGMQTAGDLLVIPVMLFGPPLALLAFGVAAGWAFRGFKTEDGTVESRPEG